MVCVFHILFFGKNEVAQNNVIFLFTSADTALLLGSLSRGKSNIENGEEDRSTQSSPLGKLQA